MKELSRRGGPYPARRHAPRRMGGKQYTQYARWKSRRRGTILIRRLLGVAGIVCLLVGVIFVFDSLTTGGDEIQRGVEVGGVGVGGMTQAEAREAIARKASATFVEVELVSGEERFSLSGERLGVNVDAAAAAKEAAAVGRGGIFGVLAAYLGGGVEVAANVEYDEEAAREALAGLAGEFDREARDASFSMAEDGEVVVEEAQVGRILDQEATLTNLDRALMGFSDEAAVAASEKEPGLATEEVRGLAPTELIGEYKTDYAWDPDPGRQANLKMASDAIDGTLLAPGEGFSANDKLAGLDYRAAKVFADGGISQEVGGGLCQVSSTLYMAANYAGLEIVERNQHYAELPYIQPGFDATVWFGAQGTPELDMKFENTTDGYLLVREFVDADGFLVAQVFAQEPSGKSVVMNTEKVDQSTLTGIKWVTSKKVIGADGEVLFDDVMYEGAYSYNPPVPEELKHETSDPRVSGWLDPSSTTGWAQLEE